MYYIILSLNNNKSTLPETNIAHENPIFPGKYHQNGGFSMAMLVSGSVIKMDRLGCLFLKIVQKITVLGYQ